LSRQRHYPSQQRQQLESTASNGKEPAFKRAKTQDKADIETLFSGVIVIVDDDTMARTATKGALHKRYGVEVQAYSSGQDFLDSRFLRYLGFNQLTGTIPDSLGNLKSLTEL
jgi:hypothetical protein